MGDRVTATKGPYSAETAYVLGVIALGSVLRLRHLGAPSFWLDEALSVAYARMPCPQFVHVMLGIVGLQPYVCSACASSSYL